MGYTYEVGASTLNNNLSNFTSILFSLQHSLIRPDPFEVTNFIPWLQVITKMPVGFCSVCKIEKDDSKWRNISEQGKEKA